MLAEPRERFKGTDSALLTAILVVGVLYFAREIFTPLVLAGLLAFLLAPAAKRLERWGLKRLPAALVVVLLSVAALGGVGWALIGQVYNLAVELPRYQQNVTGKIASLNIRGNGRLSETIEMLANDRRQIMQGGAHPTSAPDLMQKDAGHVDVRTSRPVSVTVEQPAESIATAAGRTLRPLVSPLTTAILILVFLVFMLLGREDLRDRGLRLLGKGQMHTTTKAVEDASQRVSRYLLMQLVVNLSCGAVIGLVLWPIGIPNPLLWGVLCCLLRFVPYIGILLAAAGPILLAMAVSPHWSLLAGTALAYAILELVAGNIVEPMLYGASTGISPIGILTATIFWTLLWGIPGLLLSTPLTVCLVVIGRRVPHLEYLDVLFGDNEALAPPDRFYQRMLASNAREATAFLEEMLKTQSIEQICDSVMVPAMTSIEEARHSDEMTGARADEVLQNVEEISEDVLGRFSQVEVQPGLESPRRVVCLPARDFADEVACQLAVQILSRFSTASALSAESSTAEILQSLEASRPDAICVMGVPPQAIRHLRMRCRQLRTTFPAVPVVACILSEQCDLSRLRARISSEDAQHVVCSLQLMKDYLYPLLCPPEAIDLPPAPSVCAQETIAELADLPEPTQLPDLFDEPKETVFNHLTVTLARAFDAPIALIFASNARRGFWESQCGLPDDWQSASENEWEHSICREIALPDSGLVIADIEKVESFANDPFLARTGIRFFAGAPLNSPQGETIGSLCVLDTRARELGEDHRELLMSVAKMVMQAIELHSEPSPEGLIAE